MKKAFILLIIFLVLLTGTYFFIQSQLSAPGGSSRQEVTVEVKKGSGLLTIASALEEKGLVKNRYFFILYVVAKKGQSDLKAGVYKLSPSMTPRQIAQKLWSGEEAKTVVTIPEGFNLEEVEQRLSSTLQTNISITSERAAEHRDRFPFLSGAPKGSSLEGFLLPDTYFFRPDAGSKEVVDKMLSNFKKKAEPSLKGDEEQIFESVVMASLLEKEVIGLEDKKIASGILWKRLEVGMPLQVDATIVYITGKRSTEVSRKELDIDSPYNTYRYRGLPPGPICNPGLESIEAAQNPVRSEYWYYLTTKEGETIFSKTLIEHNINKAKYL